MRPTTRPLWVTVGLARAAAGAPAAGTVQGAYVKPEMLAVAGLAGRDREDNLKLLTSHFEVLAKRHLGDGQKLSIEVLDVDLAGETRPLVRRAGQDLRVLKGKTDWPRIKLRYTLESPSEAPRKAEQTVSDMAYLQRLAGYYRSEPLGYERRMLDDWFATEFGAAASK